MLYVSPNHQISRQELDEILTQPGDITLPWWDILLKIDYVYHHNDVDYAGGLSFIDRLIQKLGFRHSDWNADGLKAYIVESDNKVAAYMDIIQDMLELNEDAEYYGL